MENGIGERLKAARQAKKLSQEQLAAVAGTTAITVSRYERNVYGHPRGALLQQLAAALDVTADWLLGKDEASEQAERRPSLPPSVEAVIEEMHPSPDEEDYLRAQAWDVEARHGMLDPVLVRMRLMHYRAFHRAS